MSEPTRDIKQLTLSIAAVERDTGLTKDTLRVWERRYGFPQPDRDGGGERCYPLDQVEKLRVVKRLMDGAPGAWYRCRWTSCCA
jgi:MerR family transcriptional regulator, light-induced transcriptional regulator